ncbi:MAG: sodium-dependent bicarbonate transport family permease [Oscillatoriales cyanobacterium RM2_1_1]|nr:sodium-dependent bicarbonate transport family permease [Oscillatoriales cyanobacterium SM2_3_0]NJO45211.1 sodium-dependent bicarbonate transport family permease [Oscillatoriales cyanobacterium RM2_1_1]
MNSSLILSNILNPPILFFFIGLVSVFLKSDLEIPQPIPKLFSLYLLFAIGFKGGHELHESGLTLEIAISLMAAVLVAAIVPIYSFFILRLKLDIYNSAAIAATYGSISAVTFVTASTFLGRLEVDFGGHMVAALALMESPAIIVGLLMVRIFANRQAAQDRVKGNTTAGANPEGEKFSWGEVLRESCLNGSVFLLVGSLLVGLVTSQQGWESLEPFTGEMFYGVLTFFLLDMGLVAARRFQDLRKGGAFLIGFSILMPVLNALLGIAIAALIRMSAGDALLFAVLCASASYIAVPAAMRLTVPEANPSLYISMALALTFPFNIIIGIPVYFQLIQHFWVR